MGLELWLEHASFRSPAVIVLVLAPSAVPLVDELMGMKETHSARLLDCAFGLKGEGSESEGYTLGTLMACWLQSSAASLVGQSVGMKEMQLGTLLDCVFGQRGEGSELGFLMAQQSVMV